MGNRAPREQWSEYKRLVLNELETLREKADRLERDLASANAKIAVLESNSSSKADVAELKSMAKIWGALAGAIPGVIGVAIAIITLMMSA